MSLRALPTCKYCSFFLKPVRFSSDQRRASAVRAVVEDRKQQLQLKKTRKNGVAVVWFKHDLRIDDHPGLVAASESETVVPLYVFDTRILSRFSEEVLEVLLFALQDLRKSLIDKGSNLFIRVGNTENVIRKLVTEVKASNIIVEEEVEYQLMRLIDNVKETLNGVSCPEGSPKISFWRASLHNFKSLEDLPSSFIDFQKLQFPISLPSVSPSLPQTPKDLDWGPLPSIEDLKNFLNVIRPEHGETWISCKDLAESKFDQQLKELSVPLMKLVEEKRSVSDKYNQGRSNQKMKRRKVVKSPFITREGSLVGGGTNAVLDTLVGYLRYSEGTGRDDWQELHEKVRSVETREGAAFEALFGPALSLGIVSRRRVYAEAIKYEKERNGGLLSPFGYSSVTIAAAIEAVISMEWYRLMALNSRRGNAETHSIRIWSWKGHLIQYSVAGHKGPAVLLVHGFGAFHGHFRDNINGLANAGNHVWAVTLLGFGQSEKPNIVYTEQLWAEVIKDFIVDVVAEPVHLIGNSLGGYFAAIVAGLWPSLVKSVVLINSAGSVIPGYPTVTFLKERSISGPVWLAARVLPTLLRFSLKNIVADCYPVNRDRADDWLINEMTRASHDPGVIYVLENIFSFNLSIPLNYLLEGLQEKVLIIQGMKDPICDSKATLAMFRKYCPGFSIRELDAGHCPHDEKPEEVNSFISQWVLSLEMKSSAA